MRPVAVEAISVCRGYGDFLAVTSQHNQSLFDRWVIVTSEDDEETIEVCRRRSMKVLTTNDFSRDDGNFNKGRFIQRGLDQLSCSGWTLHLDADIVLPPMFRQWLGSADLSKDCIYGCDRIMINSWEAWKKFQASGYDQTDYHCRVRFPDNLPVGTRWASPTHGYTPIGFFQLFYGPDAVRRGYFHKSYSHQHNDASRSDIQFSLQWDRSRRLLLPEVIVMHLDSESSPLGKNWNGRKTKRFEEPRPSPTRVDCGLGAS